MSNTAVCRLHSERRLATASTLMRRKKRVVLYDPCCRWCMTRAFHRPRLGNVALTLPLLIPRGLKHGIQIECMVRDSGAHLKNRSCKSLVLQERGERSRVMGKWRFQ